MTALHASEAPQGAAHRILIAADQLAQILRIEAARQLGRADQIAEQDRQLPPLGIAPGRLGGRGGNRFICLLGERALQSTPMTERQP